MIVPAGAPPSEPGETAPVAYTYAKDVPRSRPIMVELPATDADGSALTFTLVDLPTQATVAGDGPSILLQPDTQASGYDTLTFFVSDGEATSATATVTIRYGFRVGDRDGDGDWDLADFRRFQTCFSGPFPDTEPPGDCVPAFDRDFDDDVDSRDYRQFNQAFSGPQ